MIAEVFLYSDTSRVSLGRDLNFGNSLGTFGGLHSAPIKHDTPELCSLEESKKCARLYLYPSELVAKIDWKSCFAPLSCLSESTQLNWQLHRNCKHLHELRSKCCQGSP